MISTEILVTFEKGDIIYKDNGQELLLFRDDQQAFLHYSQIERSYRLYSINKCTNPRFGFLQISSTRTSHSNFATLRYSGHHASTSRFVLEYQILAAV